MTSIPTATDEHVRDVVHPAADADRASTTVELHDVEPIPVVQAKLAVSMPGDPLEREADAVAERVLRGAAPRPLAHPAAGRLQRVPPRQRGPPPAGVPRSVGSIVQTGGGSLLDPRLRARIEPHVGMHLGHVRVRREPAAAAAARELQARAFTSGSTIFLAAGSSPADLALMAHEATHVAQQGTSALARSTLMRDFELTDLIPDSVLDAVRSLVRAIPGYDFLSTIVGQDLLTGGPAGTSREELVEKLLTYGPFGAAVGPLLSAIDVLGDVVAVITEGLVANNLTFARIKRDIDTAWSEFSVAKGIDGNAAIVERLIRGLLSDVLSFVGSIAARVIEIVRKVVAEVAEPLLETPEFKPTWDLTKKVLHYDPLRGEDVAAETVDIVADFLTLIGEEERLAQMRERGTLQKTADWLDAQLATFKSLIGELGGLFSAAWDAIQPENLPDLLTNLKDLAQRAFGFLGRVVAFGTTLIAEILALVKDSLLAWLSETAHGVQGFRLLTVILGEDPFTGEAVERNATNLIRGFITLLPGGEETYDKLAEAGVIADAASEIESSMAELGISTDLITGIFTGIWDTLTLDDLLDPLGAFGRILDQFGEPLLRLVEFAMVVLKVVITLVLRLLNFPGDLLGSIVATASQAIDDIANDPVAFFRNMLAAVKLGFSNFLGGIVGYLTNGLASWLFRGLGKLGIEAPPDYSAGSILTLVCQVLNLTAERMWQKLSDHLGAETVGKIRSAIDKLTGIWTFLVEVQRDGIRAISRFLAGQLSGLWDSLLGMAKSFLMDRVITVGTTKLLSLLDPTGIMAVVNSFAAFFNAVRSAFEYFNDILQIVAGYVNTLAAVAQGNIGPGAAMLEQGLAASIPVAIGFLAAQVGLGNVPEKIVELIEQLRVLVDKGIDWLIQKAIALGKAALKALGLGPKEEAGGEHDARLKAATADVHVLMEAKGAKVDDVKLQLPQIKERYQLTTLVLVSDGEYTYRPHAVINPQFDGPPGVLFTPEQLAELAKVAETWIAHIKKKRQNAQFHANPEAYIRGVPEKQKPGQVTTGQAVEAAAAPQIIALAAEAGLTVVKNIHLQAKGAKDKNGKVTTVGGTQAELDFAIFGSQGVQEVISAKLSPQAVDLGKYRSKLKLYYSCPDDIAGGLVSWLKTNCGDSGAWPDAVRMDVVSSGGTMSIQKFRATFLSKVPVDRIVISSVTPGPEHAAGLQLRATAPELISHMIALITPRV